MTDPKAQADAIDPRNGHLESGKKSLHVQAPIAALIAASDTIRTQQSRIEELESAAALAGNMAIEEAIEACNAVYDRHAAAAQITPEFAWKCAADHCCDALRSLSKPLDRTALIERGARQVHAAYLRTATALGWPIKPEVNVEYAALSEDAKELDRATVRAILSAWIGEETK